MHDGVLRNEGHKDGGRDPMRLQRVCVVGLLGGYGALTELQKGGRGGWVSEEGSSACISGIIKMYIEFLVLSPRPTKSRDTNKK